MEKNKSIAYTEFYKEEKVPKKIVYSSSSFPNSNAVSGSKALIVAPILSTGLIIGVLQHYDYIAYANFKKRLSRIPFSSEVTMMEHNYSSYYYINNGIVTLNFIKDYSVLSKRLQSQRLFL